ncbi:uncharacterized protein B0I36DRAFT_124169 [Microdochium trichocladiopsis]|uniref:Uncharacterized protein n=1 Tax=Microdochium trichocladiopsis TaxID=1682393 RepID=A0A9P8YA41_9PEZI|nr:uncharacterized protein B0I36DRAFT_124169 [Microdochium trichocladiopsis]KAH7031559.1 hypothetical protein B0I36DRAFT_124169 [Microdochium trichocladiopsis]
MGVRPFLTLRPWSSMHHPWASSPAKGSSQASPPSPQTCKTLFCLFLTLVSSQSLTVWTASCGAMLPTSTRILSPPPCSSPAPPKTMLILVAVQMCALRLKVAFPVGTWVMPGPPLYQLATVAIANAAHLCRRRQIWSVCPSLDPFRSEAPEISGGPAERTKTLGLGWRQNIRSSGVGR